MDTPYPSTAATPRTGVWGMPLTILPLALLLPFQLLPPVNHDVAAVLLFTQRWLGGERLYADLIDVNPPLVFILNLPAAALAAWTGLDAVLALRLLVLGLGGICWRLAWRARARDREGPTERAVLDVLPGLFLLGAGYDFAQREHLMAVAALPYVLGAAARSEGRLPARRIAAAVLAAIFFALKPYFLAVPALVEAGVLAARLGSGRATSRLALRDLVPWTMAACWLAYVLCIPLFFPAYAGAVLPLVWGFYVDLGGLSAWQVLLVPRMTTALALFLPGLWLAWRRPSGALARMLALAGLGAAMAAMAQRKGWSYHFVPLEMFAGSLAALLAARSLDQSRIPARGIAAILILLFALYGVCNGGLPWMQLAYRSGPVDELARALRREAAGRRVLVLSPAIYPVYPAVNYAGVAFMPRTMDTWLLQAAYAHCPPGGRTYREEAEMGPAERFMFRSVAEDIARNPPAAVVLDRHTGMPACGGEFDFIAYFSRNPLFAAAWAHYRLATQTPRFKIYTRHD